ncbi:MAG: hypothetical protein FGM32_10930 [Candidatus Kapabacteria bacterium]|nr:hypothetical protein [Candidatus Kapabacteria bacterium]
MSNSVDENKVAKPIEELLEEPSFTINRRRIEELLMQLEQFERGSVQLNLSGSSGGSCSPVTHLYKLT